MLKTFGRVFFGDLTLFDGSMTLRTRGGIRMGQIVLTDCEQEELEVEIRGLTPGDSVRIVRTDREVEIREVVGTDYRSSHTLQLSPESGGSIRVEVYTEDGTAKVFSNPIHFVRRPPPDGLPPSRSALAIAGLATREIERFTIVTVQHVEQDGIKTVLISGRGERGSMSLDVSEFASSVDVHIDGHSANAVRSGPLLILTDLEGSITIMLSAAASS